MKITIDTKTGEVKSQGKLFQELDEVKRNVVESFVRDFLRKNTQLTDYEEDCMWMSYRYCIGRHTIASHMHAGSIWKNCQHRMSPERQLFTAFDINREIENNIGFIKPYFHFPLTSLNRIYASAVDIVCQFIEDYNIQSEADFIKYRDVYIKFYDNERGYTFETVTWEEYLRPRIHELMKKHFNNDEMSEDYSWNYFTDWKAGKLKCDKDITAQFEQITRDMPNLSHYYMHDFEDLFTWNDLVHCLDYEHHHKSILKDGSEVEWFWSWTNKTEKHDDGNYYLTFGYKKIRVPVNEWNGNVTTYIPDESIKEDIY